MNICVFGANSAISKALSLEILNKNPNSRFFLFGRNMQEARSFKDELINKSASAVEIFEADFLQGDINDSIIDKVFQNKIDITIICYGVLGKDISIHDSYENLKNFFIINLISKLILLTQISKKIKGESNPTIVVFSSVAGDRGRRSNFIYGSLNSALTEFSSGLRSMLHGKNINLLTVKPGLIDTPMTKDFKKTAIWSNPKKIAPKIYSAIINKKDTIYVPWYWGVIMLIIRLIPEKIFKRLNI